MNTTKKYSINELIRLGEEKDRLKIVPLPKKKPDKDQGTSHRNNKKYTSWLLKR